MKLFLLSCAVMVAFAGNSILTRLGVFSFGADPMAFALLRVASGAAVLAVLVILRGQKVPVGAKKSRFGALALAIYMIGFSWAYLQLDAGLGALILFGVMQVAMFAFAVYRKDEIPLLRWIGGSLALIGLCILLLPGADAAVHLPSALAMTVAGVGWAAYTLLGQGAKDPLVASSGNFVLCLPLVLLAWVLSGMSGMTTGGAVTAVISGAVTSGLGYALWYRVVPQLSTTIAAIAQLSVPVIAVIAGVILLGEDLTLQLLVAGALVLGGIGLSVLRRT